MPREWNDIDFARKSDSRTKQSKKPPPEPWALPPFTTLQMDDCYAPGEASLPPILDQHDPLALLQLLFNDEMVDKIVERTNGHATAHPIEEEAAPLGRPRKWKPVSRLDIHGRALWERTPSQAQIQIVACI
ncbi:hypothetical protein K432DRAFT_405045 [Lepidopterella palustris CBS 459.81]|uniref:Uncharacterized protein n=1 Tax=Lepidopterella palustris CBS 459.81 TaxID=1314670 RepID=A0A8E2JFI5_9PEZI|nr:hypothetical protein K432DRAFT_405045 [Lepidopterella palustris CBS 459.81]